MTIVEGDNRAAKVAPWARRFIGRKGTAGHDLWVHAGSDPPKAAAQSGGFPYGCLSHDRFSEGFRTPARLKWYRPKTQFLDRNVIGTVRMVAEEISVVSVADEVAIEIPLPGCAVVETLSANAGS